MKKLIVLLVLISVIHSVTAQKNKFDSNGKRHGFWKKSFKNGNTRYFGKFDHGKEIGVFKFYSLASPKKPVIIKVFNKENTIASSKFYDNSGNLMSEGNMDGKNRIGKWVYYHKGTENIMQEEFYIKGKLDGTATTFFKNKKPTIIANYKKGLLDGSYKRFSVRGKIYQDVHYKEGKLYGMAIYADRLTGIIIKKGNYWKDIKVGIWEFYYEGELSDTKDYSKKRNKK